MKATGGGATFLRQFTTLLTKNSRLLKRQPLHLLNLLFNSIPSILLAYAAGRDERGPTGDFPPLTSCGMVDPTYILPFADDYMAMLNIPISMNEVWRDGLPVWIMGLGATFSGISVFLLVRSELVSGRWGTLRSAGLRDSAYWSSWFVSFAVCGIINSLIGSIVTVLLPVHVFQQVNFGVVFALIVFLYLAMIPASFVLAAACGTIQSTTLMVVVIIGIIIAGAIPMMGVAASRAYGIEADYSTDTYGYRWGDGGAFWLYTSSARTRVEYLNSTFNYTTLEYDYGEPTLTQCEVPILSYQQGHYMKTPEERDEVPLEDIFTGCFVTPGASTSFSKDKGLYFFWYFIPQTHFMSAWSNILGYTSLPGNIFSFAVASKSSESLANESLSSHLASEGTVSSPATKEASLFPEGSTVLAESYYFYDYDNTDIPLNNCPSDDVIENQCRQNYDYTSSDCHFAKPGYPSTASPSVNDCIGYLASLVAIYLAFAFYIGAVLPQGNGAALKFYFFLQPGYWRRSSGSDKDDSDVEAGISVDGEEVGRVGVEALDVSKSYGKVAALKPFSIKLNVGEVISLLGHNGAGKSTFVNMLCCEKNPSSGDVFVFGQSVKSNPHLIKSVLGECRQDDYLYPKLSAREHLELFAGIRGLAKEQVESDVQLWLESVDLDNVQDNFSSTFSGGMKRRLSVALSTIGPSKLIVLDEPTTGMDPISRRYVWDHITQIKPGRVVLLTTHAMEEADLLSDSVAIMCDGKLVASGSPLQLKHEFGSAVQFSVVTNKTEEVAAHTKSHFASVKEWIALECSDGYLTLQIQKVTRNSDEEGAEVSLLASYMGWLEDEEFQFTLSNSSLEEVFLAVTKDHHQTNSSAMEIKSKRCCLCCCRSKPNVQIAEEFTDNHPHTISDRSIDEQPKAALTDYSRNLSVKAQTIALFRFYLKRNWFGRPSIVNWVVYVFFTAGNMMLGFGLPVLWPSEMAYFFLLLTVFLLSMIMISIVSPIYGDRAQGLYQMMTMQSMFNSSFLLGTSLYSWMISFIYTFIMLTLFFATPIYRDADTPDCSSNDINNYTYYGSYDYNCGYSKFGDKPTIHPASRNTALSGQHNGEDVTVYAHPGASGYGLVFAIIVVFSLSSPGTVLSSSFLPGYRIPLLAISLLLLVACISPLILIATKLNDAEFFENCAVRQMKEINACSQYSFDLDNVNSTFVECVGLEIASPEVLCLAASTAHASILPQFGLFYTLTLSLMSNVVFYSEPSYYAQEVLIPGLQGASCAGNSCSFMYVRQIFGQSLGYMVLGSFLLLIFGFAVARVVLYPLPIRARLRNSDNSKNQEEAESRSHETEMVEVDSERMFVNTCIEPILNTTDDSSINYKYLRENRQNMAPVLTHQLRKVYGSSGKSPPKVALSSLDLHVPYGQVLGLLGKNGAGKTTALKILAGMDDATSGIGLVAGYNVDTERISVYERLGNCPQFDCVWKAQSVQSHLEFYARLKGLDKPSKAALEIATAVGLGAPDVYIRPSGQLSGGMRRRLSIAVSLIGSPSVVNLDEPTTGLDPSTRHEIWSLVRSFATPERAIIITTHMMIEAALFKDCTCIQGPSQGDRNSAAPQRYLLQLNLLHNNEESINGALKFVRNHVHEDAEIVVRQAKTVGINLPRDLSMKQIFTKMYSEDAAEVGINQFLVSQSSLEDVFVSLG